jgi:putative toxin-antitoxin system antitoxin component (TIGR02293 family)
MTSVDVTRQTLLASALGVKAAGFPELGKLVKAGLRIRSLDRFHQRSGLPWDALGGVLHLPPRTLARRRKAGRLAPPESDRLVRVAQLFERAVRLFDGDTASATSWLQTGCQAFSGQAPLEVAQTELGAAEVEQLLGRLEHGVFS